MTYTTTQLPARVLRTADHVLASLPFLLGFQPQCSAVVLWLRDGALILTQRIDLPQLPIPANASSVLDEWAISVIESASHADSDQVLIAIFPTVMTKESGFDSSHSQDRGHIAGTPLVAAISRALVASGKYPGAAWLVIEDDYWEFDFTSSDFSHARKTLDPQVVAEVHDDFVSAGWRHLVDRQEVINEFDADPHEQQLMLIAINQQKTDVNQGEAEVRRDECINTMIDSFVIGTTDQRVLAQIITGLVDITVRDCFLWQLTHQNRLASSAETFRIALRATPAGLRAPLATVTALAFWLQGDGVRASAALEQARLDKADYGLAHLVEIALTNGLPPAAWNETMVKMSYEVCRSGVASDLQ